MPAFPFTTKNGASALIRPATPRDARAALAVVWEAVHERPRTLITTEDEFWRPRDWRRHRLDWGPRGVWLVAEVEGVVAGSGGMTRPDRPGMRHTAEFGVTIASHARGIGIGRAMMDAAESWAREFGVVKITLGVFTTNDVARALYVKAGYVEEGVERRQVLFRDGDCKDIVRMAKFLD